MEVTDYVREATSKHGPLSLYKLLDDCAPAQFRGEQDGEFSRLVSDQAEKQMQQQREQLSRAKQSLDVSMRKLEGLQQRLRSYFPALAAAVQEPDTGATLGRTASSQRKGMRELLDKLEATLVECEHKLLERDQCGSAQLYRTHPAVFEEIKVTVQCTDSKIRFQMGRNDSESVTDARRCPHLDSYCYIRALVNVTRRKSLVTVSRRCAAAQDGVCCTPQMRHRRG